MNISVFAGRKSFYLFILLVFVLRATESFSQSPDFNTFNLKNMLPTSPEAAMLGRFGDIPIGYYTGTADISIPLYTIKEAGLEIPIVLRYHSSGVKVEDQASNTGLGWSLDPGGAVIQIVNGKADVQSELIASDPTGYAVLKNNIPLFGLHGTRNQIGYDVFQPCFASSSGDTKTTLMNLLSGYGQPDIYQYSFPGGFSGKFYINPETNAVVFIDKKSELKIVKDINGWTATTLDGHQFFFSVLESSSTLDVSDYTGLTWKLSKIKLNNGKEINFEYSDGYYEWFTYSETYHTEYPLSLNPSADNFVQNFGGNSKHFTKNLRKIITDSEIIDFNFEDRIDLYGLPDNDGNNLNGTLSTKRIKSVDISSKINLKKIKSFNFSYDYFSSNSIGGTYRSISNTDAFSKRLKLLSIQEIGYTSGAQPVSNPPYTFEYNAETLPLKTSFARDYWGYYNGKSNTRMIPDPSFLYYSGYNGQEMPAQMIDKVSGGDRAPDKFKMMAGMLMRVNYPTGGYTTFDYEPHTFSKYIYPTTERLQETERIVNLTDMNTPYIPNPSYRFRLNRKLTFKFTSTINGGAASQGLTFYDLQPSTVTLKKIVGTATTILKTWQMTTADKTQYDINRTFTWEEYVTLDYDPNAEYELEASLTPSIPTQVPAQGTFASVNAFFKYYDVMDGVYTESYGGGVRVAGIRNYDSDGSITGNKRIYYVNADNTTSGLLMSKVDHVTHRKMSFETELFPTRYGISQDIWFISSESAIPYSDAAGGNMVGYSRIEEKNLAKDNSNNGKHVYYYYNTESKIMENTPENPDLLNGLISREEIYNLANDPLFTTVYTYLNKFDFTFMGVKVFQNFITSIPCDSDHAPDYSEDSFVYQYYPINSKWYVPSSKTTTQYSGPSVLNVVEDYTYNSIGQLISSARNDSKNQNTVTYSKYPIDLSTPSDIQIKLKVNNLYNNLIEQNTISNYRNISTIKYDYREETSPNGTYQIVQNKIDRSFNNIDFDTPVEFEKYGNFKTITQVKEKGVTTSMIWSSDGSHVLAVVNNAQLSQVSFASFEDGEVNNFNINVSRINTSMAHTGSKCYNLVTGENLTRTGLTASTQYIVSYWSKNVTPFSIPGTIGNAIQGQTIGGWTYFEHRITNQTSVTITGNGYIDELRLYPGNSQMSTYTFEPGIGTKDMTDANNVTTYYEYDAFGRLQIVKDDKGNIVKTYSYHYKQ